MSEPFSFTKFVGGFTGLTGWAKAVSLGLKLLGIALLALTIYRAWFMPTNTTSQETSIQNVENLTIQQNGKKKIEPFIGIFGSVNTDQQATGGFFGGIKF